MKKISNYTLKQPTKCHIDQNLPRPKYVLIKLLDSKEKGKIIIGHPERIVCDTGKRKLLASAFLVTILSKKK